jgi:hypothetical protein
VKPVDLARLSASIARVVVFHNPDVPAIPEDALSDLEGQGA